MKVFKELGLTAYEDKIYATLLVQKRATGKEIAERSGVPLTAVYPNLKSLEQKRLIQKIIADPTQYAPLSPKTALTRFIEHKKKDLDLLKLQGLQEAEALFTKSAHGEKREEIITLTHGKEFSTAVYREALKKAKHTFYILGWRFEKVGERYNFLTGFRKLIKNHVDIRIIVTGDYAKQAELVEIYKKEGILLRYAPLDNVSILVVDQNECKITLKNRDLPDKYNLHILDTDLARALHSYFLNVWDTAETI